MLPGSAGYSRTVTEDPARLQIGTVAGLLGASACRFDLDVLAECGSTNTELLAKAGAGAPSGTVLAAERQTAGRGRRGRAWLSAPGDSLTFSLLWRFAPGTSLSGLSLAVGLAVAQAIENVGDGGTVLRLKWPNDILLDERKLGGILIELAPGAPHVAVIGIGINRHLPAAMPPEMRDVAAALGDATDANRLLAALLLRLLDILDRFAAAGFAPLREAWMARHAWNGRPVLLHSDFAAPRPGLCRGVDADGALLLETGAGIERILAGEVSLRAAP